MDAQCLLVFDFPFAAALQLLFSRLLLWHTLSSHRQSCSSIWNRLISRVRCCAVHSYIRNRFDFDLCERYSIITIVAVVVGVFSSGCDGKISNCSKTHLIFFAWLWARLALILFSSEPQNLLVTVEVNLFGTYMYRIANMYASLRSERENILRWGKSTVSILMVLKTRIDHIFIYIYVEHRNSIKIQ